MSASMTRHSLLTAFAGITLLTACEKNGVQTITAPIEGGAFVRFHNLSVASPSVNFFANTQKVTAASSTSCSPPPTTPNPLCTTTGVESTTGTAYGSSALGGNYAMLTPGTVTLTGRISATTDNGLSVSSVSAPLERDRFYSYFMSGVYSTTTKTTDAFLVEDKLPTTFDYTKSYVRVVNGSPNAPSLAWTSQLQGSTTVVPVASGVAYKSASELVTITPGLTDVSVALTGNPPVLLTGVNFLGGHVYTIALRGDITNTVVANRLAITIFTNR
jgi:Domain of unknown function (DUF4397)